jgi:nucleoside-diphosphate-sugar epimerase
MILSTRPTLLLDHDWQISNSELKKIGAKPEILSIETATVPELTSLLKSSKADGVLFAAGAGGKGDPERTRKVDYEGAVKVYDAMEAGNVKRLVLIGAVDIRDRSKGYPEWYDDADSGFTHTHWWVKKLIR